MGGKTIIWLLVAALFLLTNACDRKVQVPVPDVPDPEEEIIMTEEVFQPADEEEVGSITLNIVNSFTDGLSYINCDTTHTIWMQFYENFPKLVSKNKKAYEEVVCDVELIRTGVIGSASTTAIIPVTYTFNTQFSPYPKCELTLQVDTHFAFSQIKVLHDSMLGDVPLPDGLGDDLITVFPAHVFRSSGEAYTVIEGLVTLKMTPDDYVIPSWTKCVYP
ncbi:MAG: hypothetical protein FD147_130 [Chloroflexi bacterium]|nr:MAG: hypothetical protein FD147_130 [Chloroflexota bacterium]